MSEKLDRAKERAKKAAGDLTDDQSLKNEGRADEAKGKVKGGVDKAAEKVKAGIRRGS
jgi:uncharacterized protein YjbJ (UPF0337 family)